MRPATTRAFTLTELCVALVLVVFLAGAVLPTVTRLASTASDRKTCFDNLRQIGQAILLYANENKGSYPRTVFNPGNGAPTPTAYTRPLAATPFQAGGPDANDVTAALFLLLRTQDIQSRAFVCPAAPVGEPWDFGGRRSTEVSNFPGRQFLSYSYANPYPSRAAMDAGFKMNYTLGADFALAADMNSGTPALANLRPTSSPAQMKQANTRSHAGEGQNVLYADGHVEFQDTVFAGVMRAGKQGVSFRDNIFTAGDDTRAGAVVRSPPRDATDSVLLPTFADGAAPAPGSSRRATPQPAPAARPPSSSNATPAARNIHVHDTHATQAPPPWVWVVAFGGALLLMAGMAVFVIVVARAATRLPPMSHDRAGRH